MTELGPLVLEGRADGGARVGVAVGMSIAVHLAALVAFVHLESKKKSEAVTVISDVELRFEEEQAKPRPARAAAARPPASMKDFLKMALPAVVKPRPIDVARPEAERKLLEMPQVKLEDRGRRVEAAAMKLDLNERRADVAKIASALPTERRSTELAALPKLEEVGTRRAAPKVLQAAALEEEARRGPRLAAIESVVKPETRRAPQAAAILSDAAPAQTSALNRLANLLPEKTAPLEMAQRRPETMRPTVKAPIVEPLPNRDEGPKLAAAAKSKKAVEIEGPLQSRKVRAHSLPQFPDWLREAGVIEADVAIKFFVNPEGSVVADRMQVERSSGYGRLDRLAMEHLKAWRFEPLALAAGDQWGIITFRFLLE